MKFYKINMTPNSFWKIMMKFNFMCNVAATVLVKLVIEKQRNSLLIKF